jgi:hypothetical protein
VHGGILDHDTKNEGLLLKLEELKIMTRSKEENNISMFQ